MAVEIQGEQRAISRIFNDEFMFSIPPYQRPYAWTNEQAEQLLDDLLDYLGDSLEPINTLSPYFLGSIILIKGSGPEAQIVDGQQRLITLTILLSALRALVPLDYAQSITKHIYEAENPLSGLPAHFRLRPKPQDSHFFEQYIQRENNIHLLHTLDTAAISDSKKNMRDNADLFLKRLEKLSQNHRIRLAQFINQRCLFVVVSTPDLDSAYRIFSVLNTRGLDLSTADILKADIIGRIALAEVHDYTEKWEGAEEILGREDFEALLGHIRMLYRKQKARESILKEFREYVMSLFPDPRQLINEVILPCAEAFDIITDERYQHTDHAAPVNTYFRWFKRIPDSDWMPPAILYFTRHRDDPRKLVTFFSALERLAVSLMLRHAYSTKRIERYAKVLAAIERGDDLFATNSPLQLTDEERKDTLRVLNGDIYRQYSKVRQYILLRLDSVLSGGDATYNYASISIEHVLPQTPRNGSVWVTWFPNPQTRQQWLHRLGNLVLLSRRKNTKASNYDFAEKKNAYFATAGGGVSPFALTTQVLKEREWTPQIVERRQRELVDILKSLWQL